MGVDRCKNCNSSDIELIVISLYNNDLQDYVYSYGMGCTVCGRCTPIIYTTVDEAFEAWNLDINILN